MLRFNLCRDKINSGALQTFAYERFNLFKDQNVESGRFDVTFQFGERQLHAHSFVLWPLSKVFERNLFGELAEKGPIIVERHSYEDFKEFLTYLYLGNCNITAENVMALVDLAEYYNIKLLKDQCDEFLSTNFPGIKNPLKVYESLKLYNLEKTIAKVMEAIALDTEKILKSEEFLNVQKETIIDIVKMDDLTAKEEELFQAVLKWASHKHGYDQEKIKNEMSDILPYIRFPIMTLEFLHAFVVTKGFLFSSFEELSGILRDATAFAQNGLTSHQYSNYSNTHRGGLRINFYDHDDNKAYADISDLKLIKILKGIFNNQYRLKERIAISSINVPKIANKITVPLPDVTHYLISIDGKLAIKHYSEDEQRYRNFFEKVDTVAPVFVESERFYHDDEITFEIA